MLGRWKAIHQHQDCAHSYPVAGSTEASAGQNPTLLSSGQQLLGEPDTLRGQKKGDSSLCNYRGLICDDSMFSLALRGYGKSLQILVRCKPKQGIILTREDKTKRGKNKAESN